MFSIKKEHSPNFRERPHHDRLSYVIIHATNMLSAQDALERLCSKEAEVSSHFLIDERGQIWQLVDEAHVAFHAGLSYWKGDRNLNNISLGIEIANGLDISAHPPFLKAQVKSLVKLVNFLTHKYNIPPQAVLGHSDIAPARKSDPGLLFPWNILEKYNLAYGPRRLKALAHSHVNTNLFPFCLGIGSPHTQHIAALQNAFATYGYECPQNSIFDIHTLYATLAFQRHFEPHNVSGIAYPSTQALAGALKKL